MTSGEVEPDGVTDAGGPESAPLPPAVRATAERIFGARLPIAEEYAWLLTTDGVLRGLLGPREAPRIWDRHLLNCAVVEELIPLGATVVDVGSGAGLPGVVLAVARPDLTVTLVEAMVRRTTFLDEVVAALGLTDQITVVRGRAEELTGEVGPADVVVARALAPLDRLARWCLPLTRVGGRVLAIKGSSAEAEAASHAGAIRRFGGATPVLRRCGTGLVESPTTVVEIVRERSTARQARRLPWQG